MTATRCALALALALALAPLAVATAAAAPDPAATTPPALRSGEHDVLLNGVRLWYRVAGHAGTPVVFLHGGPGEGSQVFAKYAGPALERGLRMVYLDQRGSGHSERPKSKAYSIDLLVDDVEQLRLAFGVPKIALIGHSFGTIVAMEYAARHPANVSAMVLAGAVPDFPAALDLQCDRLKRRDPAAFARAAAALPAGSARHCVIFRAYEGERAKAFVDGNMFPKPETARLVEAADAEGGMRNTGELGQALFAQGLLDYRLERPERITAPVLVIAGAEDHQAVIEPQQALVDRLPRGRLVRYDGAGHFMFVEQPERFGRDVAAFLATAR